MPFEKRKCRFCRTEILQTTFEMNRGLCWPCKRKLSDVFVEIPLCLLLTGVTWLNNLGGRLGLFDNTRAHLEERLFHIPQSFRPSELSAAHERKYRSLLTEKTSVEEQLQTLNAIRKRWPRKRAIETFQAQFIGRMEKGDELWKFEDRDKRSSCDPDLAGVALVRAGEVIDIRIDRLVISRSYF